MSISGRSTFLDYHPVKTVDSFRQGHYNNRVSGQGPHRSGAMKLFLDDERRTPDGWVRAFTAPEAIALLETGEVTHMSLDHDLGPAEAGTGYDVCTWVEKKVVEKSFDFKNPFVPPVMTVHSANPVGRRNMELAIKMIYHHFKVTQPEGWDSFKGRLYS